MSPESGRHRSHALGVSNCGPQLRTGRQAVAILSLNRCRNSRVSGGAACSSCDQAAATSALNTAEQGANASTFRSSNWISVRHVSAHGCDDMQPGRVA